MAPTFTGSVANWQRCCSTATLQTNSANRTSGSRKRRFLGRRLQRGARCARQDEPLVSLMALVLAAPNICGAERGCDARSRSPARLCRGRRRQEGMKRDALDSRRPISMFAAGFFYDVKEVLPIHEHSMPTDDHRTPGRLHVGRPIYRPEELPAVSICRLGESGTIGDAYLCATPLKNRR